MLCDNPKKKRHDQGAFCRVESNCQGRTHRNQSRHISFVFFPLPCEKLIKLRIYGVVQRQIRMPRERAIGFRRDFLTWHHIVTEHENRQMHKISWRPCRGFKHRTSPPRAYCIAPSLTCDDIPCDKNNWTRQKTNMPFLFLRREYSCSSLSS